jgi:DNA repair protein MmcB-like
VARAKRLKAADVVRLLEERHSQDVFVSECKTGSSWGTTGCPRLDAWAMRKSWAHPCALGYEVKVDRSDFLKDEKWRGYLGYCNEFYFVCPSKLIEADELPEGVGLLWVATTGTRLYTKRRAAFREVEIPGDLFRYVLMCRTAITREVEPLDRAEFWRRWLEEEDEKKRLGHRVSRSIRRLVEERIEKVEGENRRLGHRIEKLEGVKRALEEAGIDPENVSTWNIDRRLDALRGETLARLREHADGIRSLVYDLDH